jgi:hypothetical protein
MWHKSPGPGKVSQMAKDTAGFAESPPQVPISEMVLLSPEDQWETGAPRGVATKILSVPRPGCGAPYCYAMGTVGP